MGKPTNTRIDIENLMGRSDSGAEGVEGNSAYVRLSYETNPGLNKPEYLDFTFNAKANVEKAEFVKY